MVEFLFILFVVAPILIVFSFVALLVLCFALGAIVALVGWILD